MSAARPLTEPDLPEAQRIVRRAFGTFLGAPDLDEFWTDFDYVYARFGAEHTTAFAVDADGSLAGSNFATRWGSVGFFGPLTIRPELWDRGLAQPLVQAACQAFEQWGLSHAGLFTFPHSTKHVHLYGKFGFHPRFLTAVMSLPVRPGGKLAATRYSSLPPSQQSEAIAAARALTDEIYAGLDLGGEIRTAFARNLGDTLFLWEGDSRLAGFAVCHYGPASEAGAGCCYVKFGAVRPGSGAEARVASLVAAGEGLAVAVGMANLLAGVNLSHDAMYRQMKALGFRTEIQGVKMHRDNQPAYDRPGLHIFDDWR